ncbi:Outer membrane protein W [Thalassovita mediterranea]|uniref:Outer membrane protein W n=2 Tax=Thalassovita mediterranea TaxID=340021 RepID=A0A0P1GSR4_9RHOB|nr:Outer membrane protein W [Thalassovita mediterranea]SIS32681.1 Opacity protein [Thalassovita mediterranea]
MTNSAPRGGLATSKQFGPHTTHILTKGSTMLKHSLIGATLIASAALAAPASAQDWYGSAFLGYSYADDLDYSGTIGAGPQTVETDLDESASFGITIGREFGSIGGNASLRGEIELSYRSNDVTAVDFSGNGAGNEANPGGDISSTFLLANAIVDFDTGSAFTPYVGAGIGVGFIEQNVIYGPTSNVTIRGDDEAFTAQLIAGASYEISETTSLFGDVRYARSYDVTGTRTSPAGVATVSDDLSSTSVNFGVRFKF